MSSLFSSLFLVIVGFGLSLLPCAAQDGGEVSLQFLSFPKAIDPKPVELAIGDGKTLEVQIPTNEISPTYKVKSMVVWAVGKSEIGADGKPAFKVFGQVKSLAVSKQLILLIRKGENNADGMDVIPVPNDFANFGGGQFLFLNAAKVDIAGDIGGVKFVIKPGTHALIKPKSENDSRAFQAMFYFRKNNEARPFFSSKWPVSENARCLIFFYHDPKSQHLRMHTIRDFLP